jgi:hypothetical protein
VRYTVASVFSDFSYVETKIQSSYIPADDVSGTFEVDTGSTPKLVIGISGSTTPFGAITALYAPGTLGGRAGLASNDNIMSYPTEPYLTCDGLGFAAGSVNLDFHYGGSTSCLRDLEGRAGCGTRTSTSHGAAMPELSGVAAVTAGLLGLAAMRRCPRSHRRGARCEGEMIDRGRRHRG